MAYRPIQAAWTTPPRPLDSTLVVDVFDAMAAMEKEVLGFLDPLYQLQYSYGATDLPDKLPAGRFPCVFRLPEGTGRLHSLTTMGSNSLVAHPGGTREHYYDFALYWLVGYRVSEIHKLMVASEFWCKAVDQAYSANGTLGGLVSGIGLKSFNWAPVTYGDDTFFGWVFHGTVLLQYLFQGGG